MTVFSKAIFSLALLVVAYVTWSQEGSPPLLAGVELEYTYTDGGTVVLTFYDDKLRYRWIAGPFAGTGVADRIYQSREIGDEVYLVSWHDTEHLNFVTLIVDLQQNMVYDAALIGYGTDQELSLFDSAVIQRVAR